ncbi:FecR family protein [Arcticibacter eurypsychrophilus]|uniref:FecR family protein n=1 Tax=Arcticibacter eurypsychrophilus TaxID=1434752 RepID=UPI00084DF764|nr:FecR domain-containing protein [Arcticibacter eurypsychrophilus]
MNEKELSLLLNKHEKNQCTPEEKKSLEIWFKSLSENGDWKGSDHEIRRLENKLSVGINNGINKAESNLQAWRFLKIAAIFIIALSASFLIYFKRDNIIDLLDPVRYAEVNVPLGRKAKVILSDGTKVFLNSGTRFKYPTVFNRNKREVILMEGEALFDVAHNKDKPFLVHAGETCTQVLGTMFNVKSYKKLASIEVTVQRGKVSVKGSKVTNELAMLTPGQQAVYNRKSGEIKKLSLNTLDGVSWMEGKLYFDDDCLDDVAFMLQNKYDVHILFADIGIKKLRLKASFTANDSLKEILFAIAKVNKLTYSMKGKEICFRNRK